MPEKISSIEMDTVDRSILTSAKVFSATVTIDTRVARLLYDAAGENQQVRYLDKLECRIAALEQKIKTARLSQLSREEEEEIDAIRDSFREARAKLMERK